MVDQGSIKPGCILEAPPPAWALARDLGSLVPGHFLDPRGSEKLSLLLLNTARFLNALLEVTLHPSNLRNRNH